MVTMTQTRRRPRAQRLWGTPEERFWPKVDKSGGPDACWPWNAGLSPEGYGVFTWVKGKSGPAHRFAWMLAHGVPFPDGLVTDHLCRNRACVNPSHIEAVTQHVNLHRSPLTCAGKTHCPQGHAYDEANTYRPPSGRRMCRACRRQPQPQGERSPIGS